MYRLISGKRVWGLPLAAMAVLVLASSGLAQERPDFDMLRKTKLDSKLDRDRVDAWLEQQVKQLLTGDEPMVAGKALYQGLREQLQADDATTGFKNGLVDLLAASFAQQYKPAATGDAQAGNPLPTVFVLTLLKMHDRPGAIACYRAGLADPTAGVRLVAADGLLNGRIEADAWATLLPELQKAATAEPNPVTLGRLYRAITKKGGAPAKQVITALTTILNARFERFETKGEFPAVADAEAVAWMTAQAGGTRMDATRAAARLLADAVWIYTNQDASQDQKRQLERVIVTIETALTKVAAKPDNTPKPNVTKVMSAGGANRLAAVASECDKWIGTEETEGYLNGAPFNFPRGLGIKRPTTEEPVAPSKPETES